MNGFSFKSSDNSSWQFWNPIPYAMHPLTLLMNMFKASNELIRFLFSENTVSNYFWLVTTLSIFELPATARTVVLYDTITASTEFMSESTLTLLAWPLLKYVMYTNICCFIVHLTGKCREMKQHGPWARRVAQPIWLSLLHNTCSVAMAWCLTFNIRSALIGTLMSTVIRAKVPRFVHLGI
jgi:hypothetical protein